jgi:aspartate carbamoyltransferase catalytic subunit
MEPFPHRHLLGMSHLSRADIEFLLNEAQRWLPFKSRLAKVRERFRGVTQVNTFFESSTRTLLSFELAGKLMGAVVANLDVSRSSVIKGETLLDTAMTINAMRPDIIVIRHESVGAASSVADVVDCAVVNAGDGNNEHPTQALVDALTIRRRKGRIEGLQVTICGDIRHSRVARSNIIALRALGAKIRVVGPRHLLPDPDEYHGVETYTELDQAIEGADVVMMLRFQRERWQGEVGGELGSYFKLYGLTKQRLDRADRYAIVMHPGPLNRGVEIDADVADDPERSVILRQVEHGIAVRMACLDILVGNARRARPRERRFWFSRTSQRRSAL